MSTEPRRILRCATWHLVLATGLGWTGAVTGAEAPPPPAAAQATYQVTQPDGLPSRLLAEQPSPVRSLDPAIFIELSPVTASEPAVRLPEDQQDGE